MEPISPKVSLESPQVLNLYSSVGIGWRLLKQNESGSVKSAKVDRDLEASIVLLYLSHSSQSGGNLARRS